MNCLNVLLFNECQAVVFEIEFHFLPPFRKPVNALVNNFVDVGNDALRVDHFLLDFLVESFGFDENAAFMKGVAFAFGCLTYKSGNLAGGTCADENGFFAYDAFESGS